MKTTRDAIPGETFICSSMEFERQDPEKLQWVATVAMGTVILTRYKTPLVDRKRMLRWCARMTNKHGVNEYFEAPTQELACRGLRAKLLAMTRNLQPGWQCRRIG